MKIITAAFIAGLVSFPAAAQSTTADKLRPVTGTQEEATAIAYCHSPEARPDQPQGLLSGFCEALESAQNGLTAGVSAANNPQSYARIIALVLAEGQRRGLQP